jgi:hypothetical protein
LALAVKPALVGCWLLTRRATWFVVALNTPALPPTLPPPAATAAAPTTSLASWHLFGNAHAAGRSASGRPTGAGDLAQARAARRVALDDPPRAARSSPTSPATKAAMRVGDDLPGGAKLQGVYPDRVTLARGGAVESLSLPARDSGAPASRPRASAGPIASSRRAPLPGTRTDAPFVNPNIATNPVAWNQATQQLDMNTAALRARHPGVAGDGKRKFVGVRLSAARTRRCSRAWACSPTTS